MGRLVEQLFFSKPSRGAAVVFLAGSFAFAVIFAYYHVLQNSPSLYALIIATGLGLFGIAEILPERLLRLAGLLRGTGVVIILCMIAIVIASPDLLLILLDSP